MNVGGWQGGGQLGMVAHPPCDGSSVANEASKGAKISASDIALKYNVKTINVKTTKCRNLVQHTPAAHRRKAPPKLFN
jgi:hypothetical protein